MRPAQERVATSAIAATSAHAIGANAQSPLSAISEPTIITSMAVSVRHLCGHDRGDARGREELGGRDLESYRAALAWLIERGRPTEASDIASKLMFFWAIRARATHASPSASPRARCVRDRGLPACTGAHSIRRADSTRQRPAETAGHRSPRWWDGSARRGPGRRDGGRDDSDRTPPCSLARLGRDDGLEPSDEPSQVYRDDSPDVSSSTAT